MSRATAKDIDIAVKGIIACEGTERILAECGDELQKRFSAYYLRKASDELERYRDCFEKPSGEIVIPVDEGGILAALWHLAGELGCGMRIDIRKIPVFQETIEFCNLLDINPYRLKSGNCYLTVVKDREMLRDPGLTIIGYTAPDNDKLILNGDEVQYLTRPSPDEILKI
ncbi:MAG: hypothetical protein K6C99_05295 [Lachnospiraceae bacterium]|nr:hypothetical protein [Lachnospiraceae bacterium]